MSIIRTTDWLPPVTTQFPRVQDFKENPEEAYRELLTHSIVDEVTGEETPIPYLFDGTVPVEGVTFLRIPHALSLNSAGAAGQAAAALDARIPDVVVPIQVVDAIEGAPPVGSVGLAWNTQWLDSPSSTGMWADENYVYLAVALPGGGQARVHFVIYVEYTHSVVTNEIVTAEYYQMALQPLV